MKSHLAATLAIMAGLGAADALAQPANTVDAHLAAAKAAAGFDFAGTLVRLCVAPQTAPGRDVAPGPAPDRATWVTEPAKVFDNLFFLGQTEFSAWAVTTSAGIIVIDAIFDYSVDDEVEIGRAHV